MAFLRPRTDVPLPGNLWPDEVIVDACRADLTLDNQGPPDAGFAYLTQYRLLWLPLDSGGAPHLEAPGAVMLSEIADVRKKQTLGCANGLVIATPNHVYDLDMPFFLWWHTGRVDGWYRAIRGQLNVSDFIASFEQQPEEEDTLPIFGSMRVLLVIGGALVLAQVIGIITSMSLLPPVDTVLLLIALGAIGLALYLYRQTDKGG